jgi:hypothetical protein
MIAWRTWHARNEVTHDKPLPSIEGSRRFICSYIKTLENIIGLSSEAGMIPRRGDGSIIFSGYRALRFCSSALDSELSACMEGFTMALDSSEEKIIVEMDYMQLGFRCQIILRGIVLASDIWWQIDKNYLPLSDCSLQEDT